MWWGLCGGWGDLGGVSGIPIELFLALSFYASHLLLDFVATIFA